MEKFLSGRSDEPIAIASITASELLHGVHRAIDPMIRERRQSFVNKILETVPVIAFHLAIARLHAAVWAVAGQKGKLLGPHDLIIAATALHLSYAVVTFNEREFRGVPDLAVIVP